MADVAAPASASPALTPAKKTKAAGGVKKAKTANKPAHPITSVMVNKAIADLKEKGGSSLQAIKKYISASYKVDADRLAPFIRKYLKNAVESGALVRTKGKGAAGSFKLDAKPVKGEKKPAKKPAAKPKAAGGVQKRKVKPAAAKKAVAAKPKKATAAKKAPAAKKAAPKPKSPSKAKKTAKPPTKKPKSPKAKKTVSAKSKAIKKTAAKK